MSWMMSPTVERWVVGRTEIVVHNSHMSFLINGSFLERNQYFILKYEVIFEGTVDYEAGVLQLADARIV